MSLKFFRFDPMESPMKSFVSLLLVLGSAQVLANDAPSQWERVDDNHTAVIYLDVTRIRESVVYPRVWQLHDLKSATKAGVLSRKVFVEYDCKAAKRRTIVSSSHTQEMGEGKPKFVGTKEGAWQSVFANTVDEAILLRLCGESNQRKLVDKNASGGSADHGKSESHGEAKSGH